MTHRYRQVLVLLILFVTVLTSQGCYTVLQLRASDIPDDGCQAGLYIDGPVDPYLYEYDSRYDPLFYSDPYYGYPYAGAYCSPWIYGCAGSYSVHSSHPGARHDGGNIDNGSVRQETKGERRRGVTYTSGLSTPQSQTGQTMSAPGMKPETARHLKTLRRVDTAPSSQNSQRLERDFSSTPVPQTNINTAPSFSRQSAPVASPEKPTPSPAKSSPPERRRGSTQ